MEDAIQSAIENQARKLIARHRKEYADHADYKIKFEKRTGGTAIPKNFRTPGIWSAGNHFNPTYCIKHSKYLARIIWKKIRNRTYEVEPALLFSIPKDSGDFREIMVFTIPDAAIANLFNKKLRDRNRNIQSPFCYSYRKDRTLFDAVLRTKEILSADKTYVIQYDFAKYFDTISHDYIKFIIKKREFLFSPAEVYIIERFLSHKYANPKDYVKGIFKNREAGVPQGSSLSLFLSNIAGHELDKELEKSNGSFVRFADDVICTASDYQDAINITNAFREHCYYSGIRINLDKSPGICLLDDGKSNNKRSFYIDKSDIGVVKTFSEFDYIGHKFRSDFVGISDKAFERIKKRSAKIIYIHLLQAPRSKKLFNKGRIGPKFMDWDLVTCVNELRKYIYGGLTEAKLYSFINNNHRINRFQGLMSFYPLVTDLTQFRELDGWLVSVLRRAQRERVRILKSEFGVVLEPLSDKSLIDGTWYDFHSEINVETKLPSFVLAWRTARKAFKQYGLENFEAPDYYSTI